MLYFEKSDINLPSELELKDVVLVMTRCRDVTIRFQATQVLRGPVKMIVHDGTVTVSSNVDRYFPNIELKNPRICMKPNSFDSDKVTRAKKAVELYKSDQILTPDYIVDSGEFPSKLDYNQHCSSSSSSSEDERCEGKAENGPVCQKEVGGCGSCGPGGCGTCGPPPAGTCGPGTASRPQEYQEGGI